MKKEKIKKVKTELIEVPLFGGTVEIIISDNIVIERIKRNKDFGKFDEDSFEPSALCSCSDYDLMYALFFSLTPTYDEIFHEVFHLTFRILSNVNIHLDENTNELFAYLQGYLGERVMQIIKNKVVHF